MKEYLQRTNEWHGHKYGKISVIVIRLFTINVHLQTLNMTRKQQTRTFSVLLMATLFQFFFSQPKTTCQNAKILYRAKEILKVDAWLIYIVSSWKEKKKTMLLAKWPQRFACCLRQLCMMEAEIKEMKQFWISSWQDAG